MRQNLNRNRDAHYLPDYYQSQLLLVCFFFIISVFLMDLLHCTLYQNGKMNGVCSLLAISWRELNLYRGVCWADIWQIFSLIQKAKSMQRWGSGRHKLLDASQAQDCTVQYGKYSQFSVITINGKYPLKTVWEI